MPIYKSENTGRAMLKFRFNLHQISIAEICYPVRRFNFLRLMASLFLFLSLFFSLGCDKVKTPGEASGLKITPDGPSYVRNPIVSGYADGDSDVLLFSKPDCQGSVIGTGRSTSTGSFAITSSTLTEGSYIFSVKVNGTHTDKCSSTSIGYELDFTPPSVSISAPSVSLVSQTSPAVNLTATYMDTTSVNLTTSHIVLVKTATADCGTITVANGLTTTPTISVSNCTGNGTIKVQIATGSAYDSAGNSASVTSSAFTVDNIGISSAVFNPATSTLSAIPNSVTVTFSEPVNSSSVGSSDFTIGGTCTTPPVVTVASTVGFVTTLNLSGTSCNLGQTVSITVNLSGIQDAAGNNGVGSVSVTYTLDNTGPTAAIISPAAGILSIRPSNITVVYNQTVNATSVSNSDFLMTGTCSALPSLNVTSVSGDTSVVSIAGGSCTHGQALTFTSNFAGVTDTLGNAGTGSSSVTYTFDQVGPAVSTISPITNSMSAVPSAVTVNFSEAVLAASVTASDLAVAGSCGILPTVNVLSVSGTAVNFTLSGATCAQGTTVIVTLSGASITDAATNAGTGSISSTYTLDYAGPIPSSLLPASSTVNAVPTSVSVNFDEVVNATSFSAADLVISGTCTTLPTVSFINTSGAVANFSLAGGTCANAQNVTLTLNGNTITDMANNSGSGSATSTYVIDSVGPTPSSLSPVASARSVMPSTVTVVFDSNIQAASAAASDIGISGTCTSLPTATVSSVSGANVIFALTSTTCSHGQTLSLTVNGNSFNDTFGNIGSSSRSVTYTADLNGPSVSSVSPITSVVRSIPFSVTINFNEAVDASSVSAADFSLSGTCGTLPTLAVTSIAATTATISLTGAACAHGTNAVLTVDQSGISDTAGNFGSSTSAVTYTIDNIGPTLSSAAPVGGNPPTSIDLNFSEAILAGSVSIADFVISGTCSVLPAVGITSVTGSVVKISLAGASCADSETVEVFIDAALVTDLPGNAGSGTSTLRYTYSSDVTGPGFVSFNPDTRAVLLVPFSVAVNFNESINAASVSSADFSVAGTCGILPVVSVASVVGSTVTINLSGASCAHGTTVILNVNVSGISDPVGNFGSGTVTATYTIDNVAPTISAVSPSSGAPPTSMTYTLSENILAASVTNSDFIISGTCSAPPTASVVSVSGNVITIALSGGACVSTQTVQVYFDAATVSDIPGNAGTGSSTAIFTEP